VWSSNDLKELILNKLENDLKKESSGLCSRKNPSLLSDSKPESIINLKDSCIVKELEERAPILHRVLKAVASGKMKCINNIEKDDKKSERNFKVTRAISMATSVLFRCRTPSMSALSYRLSILLWHGGAEKQVNAACYIS
jgi:hypothetical protein